MMTTDQQIDAILKEKQRIQEEERLLVIKKQETGKFTPEERRRITHLHLTLQSMNGELIKLGYKKPKSELSSDEYLGVTLRMKDIVRENFGMQKANDFEAEARRRFLAKESKGIFKLMGEKGIQHHRKLSSVAA